MFCEAVLVFGDHVSKEEELLTVFDSVTVHSISLFLTEKHENYADVKQKWKSLG